MTYSIKLTTPHFISSFEFLTEKKPTTAVVSDIFACDLTGDGIQEVIFAGRQTQPATIATWSNSTVNIFQYISGKWSDVTDTMLPDNIIEGTEPNVLFADYNRDGKMDMFIPSDTDMNYLVPSYLFLNNGTSFSKTAYDFQAWAHGSYTADVNKDGYPDVLITDYGPNTGIAFGGADGFTFKVAGGTSGASGICAADFLGDGSITILACDAGGGRNDTYLYDWELDSAGTLNFTKLSTLPTPRFELSKWGSKNFGDDYGASHDVRVVPYDFSGDGLVDALIMSRPAYTQNEWPEYTEIQFLQNKGGGNFEDVTEARLKSFNTATGTSYQPVFIDANKDGLTDIFVSAGDYSTYNSTALLMQQSDGTYVEAGRKEFSSLWSSAVSNIGETGYIYKDTGQTMQLVQGDGGKLYVFGSVAYQDTSGGMSNKVFYSELSFKGSTTSTVKVKPIKGGNGADELIGTSSGETFYAKGGNDTLTGNAGSDIFAFTTKLGPTNIDTITDFTLGEDKLGLSVKVFSMLKGDADLSDNLYVQTIVGISEQDENDYLLYDAESGGLYYDADGSGSKSTAIEFAVIGTHLALTSASFSLV